MNIVCFHSIRGFHTGFTDNIAVDSPKNRTPLVRLPREASGLRTAKDNERFKWRVGWTLPPAIPSILLRYSTGPSKTLRRRNQSQLSLLPTARTGLAVEPPRTLDSWPGICAQRPRPIGESSNTFIKRIHLLSSIMIV